MATRLEDLPEKWEQGLWKHASATSIANMCARQLREALRWIPVTERLPDERRKRYFVWEEDADSDECDGFGFLDEDGAWWRHGIRLNYVTHWRHLPEGPK
jgi:hypothetical protein